MMLYLSRHGEASHTGPGSSSSLTPKGQHDVVRVSEHLIKKKNFNISCIWHSPKTRAVQTAEIYRKAFKATVPVLEEKSTLEPDGDIIGTYQELRAWKGGNLLIVSHLPFLPNLSSLLLEGSEKDSPLSFPTAGLAAFDFKEKVELLWSLDPSSL